MIKPDNIDFTTPDAALLSHEAARFAGYDLDELTAEPTVLEDTPEYTLISVELENVQGEPVVREIKAFKNLAAVEEEEVGIPNDLAVYTMKMTTTEDGSGAAVTTVNENSIAYLVVAGTGMTADQDFDLALIQNDVVVTIDGTNPFTVLENDNIVIPVMIENMEALVGDFSIAMTIYGETVANLSITVHKFNLVGQMVRIKSSI